MAGLYAPPMHLSRPAILKRVDSTWGHDCSTRRKKIRDLSWKGFKVHPGAGCLWSYSRAKFHVKVWRAWFWPKLFERGCDEFCAILWVIDTWSATCITSFELFGLAYWFLPFAHSQSIIHLLICEAFATNPTTASPNLQMTMDIGFVFLPAQVLLHLWHHRWRRWWCPGRYVEVFVLWLPSLEIVAKICHVLS